jgi:NADP-dependent 3-hydroxy acid dehydrogenase YdfG
MEKLKDKNILVVGASGSIGKETAKLLAGSGAKVFICGRNSERIQETAHEAGIPLSQSFIVDITKPDDIAAMAKELPPLDALINTAGIGIIKPFESLTFEDLQQSIEVNLFGTFHLLKSFLPAMKEQKKGLIIHLPGVLGKTPMAGATAYAASKYALNGMMKSLREELKRTDIRITQVFLGGVDSRFWDNIDLRVQRDKMIIAEEAAKAIWFLCQQPSSGVVSEMVIQPFNHQVI